MKKKERSSGRLFGQFRLRPLVVSLGVLLIFIPLYPKFPLSAVEGTYVAIRLEDLVVFLVLLTWFFWQIKHRFPVLKKKIFWFFVLYWATGLVSLLSAWWVTDLVSLKLSFLHWGRRVEYMSLFLVAQTAIKEIKVEEWASILGVTSLLVFLYGMGQKYFGFPVVSTMNEEFSKGILLYLDKWTRISATFSGHYDLAAWLVIILALLPALIVTVRWRWLKLFLVLVGVIDFYLLILTASRISFVAYLLGITTTLFLLRQYRWVPVVVFLSLAFGLRSQELNVRLASSFSFLPLWKERVASLVFPSPASPPPSFKEEQKKEEVAPSPVITKKTEPKEEKKKILKEVRVWPKPEEIQMAAARSSQIRFAVEWPRAIRAFLKNPLFGTGYSSLGLSTDNDYLRLLGEGGLLGFLAFGLIIFHLGRCFWVGFKRNNLLAAGFLGVIVGFMANALFIDVFEASKDAFYFWLLTGGGYGLLD